MQSNRDRLTVCLTGDSKNILQDPKTYLPTEMPCWKVIGTVSRGDDIGALGQNSITGIYAQLNAGVIRSLDQRKIKAALGISNNAGAPATVDGRRRSLYIDDAAWEIAVSIGSGNASDGIRRALAAYRT